MDKCTGYKILPDLSLFLEYYCGQIVLKDLFDLKKKEVADKDYNPTFNAIGDLREAQFSISVPEIIEYSNFVKNTLKVSGKRSTAILTNTPDQVARSSIYQMECKNLPISTKIVSTVQSALEWIGLSVEYADFIEETFKKLKIDSTLHANKNF